MIYYNWIISPFIIRNLSRTPAIIFYILVVLILLTALLYTIRKAQQLKKENIQLVFFNKQTSLPNKNSLFEDAQKIFFLYPLNEITLLFLDIDNFRHINDTIGHDIGDQLLSEVGKRLISIAQPKGKVYHFGGDKFAVLFFNTKEKGLGEIMATYILAGFKSSFHVSNHELYLSLSIGVVEHHPAMTNIKQMLIAAEIAMYQAKISGKSQYVMYNSSMGNTLLERINIQKHIRHAYEENEFEIYYQPQLDLAFDRIDGFEALLRWTSKNLGPVPPNKFIKVAESNHMIILLGNYVLRSACEFIKNLEARGYPHLNISVNVSIIQLIQDDFVSTVQQTLEFLDLSPEHLELEITESLFMESLQQVLPKLKQLRKLGVRIALDDFGTGYSSLSYLTQLPITTLKLDKSFIDKIDTDQEGLIEGILYLCKRLDLNTVAEGIEQNNQVTYLKKMGCHKMQGYLFSKPLPEQGILHLLQSAPTLFDGPIDYVNGENMYFEWRNQHVL